VNHQSVRKEKYYSYSYRVLYKGNQAQEFEEQSSDYWKFEISLFSSSQQRLTLD